MILPIDSDPEGVKASCHIIQEAFEELSLEAHDTKTVHVVCGHEDWIREMTRKLQQDPASTQGFNV